MASELGIYHRRYRYISAGNYFSRKLHDSNSIPVRCTRSRPVHNNLRNDTILRTLPVGTTAAPRDRDWRDSSLEPIAASLAAYVFLGVRLDLVQYLGGAIILLAVILTASRPAQINQTGEKKLPDQEKADESSPKEDGY